VHKTRFCVRVRDTCKYRVCIIQIKTHVQIRPTGRSQRYSEWQVLEGGVPHTKHAKLGRQAIKILPSSVNETHMTFMHP
jgi:hypothetical protein